MATGTVVDVVMPQMGVSVSEGTITRWMKQVGDHIEADETIVEISTDKVDTEVPSPASGIVRELLANDGDTVPVNTRIAVIAVGDAGDADEPADAPPPPATDNAEETPATPETAQTMSSQPAPEPQAAGESNGDEDDSGRTFISPVVARMLAEHRLDVNQITGSGRGGRVTKKDVEEHLAGGPGAVAPAVAPAPAPAAAAAAPAAAAPAPVQAPTGATPTPPRPAAAGDEVVEPMSTIRRVIARNLRASIDNAVHVSTFFEVDMTRCWAVRSQVNKELTKTYGIKASFLPFIMRATVEAIQHWPWVNAEVRGTDIVVKRHVNLGVAVSVNDGKDLVVPVIHNAEELNLLGLTRALTDLAERGRTKRLTADEMSGGTFSLTNPGGFGTLLGTPIIPPPQVAILGVNAIVKRPVVVTDELGSDSIAIRQIMLLALSYDHRLVDGAYAAQFLALVKRHLETWEAAEYGV
jgi:pyruvate dehydrogenase E2 component (dihydrolipoamide acetyltransferase)